MIRLLARCIVLLLVTGCGTNATVEMSGPPPAVMSPDVNVSLDPPFVLLPSGETAEYVVSMQGSVAGPWTLSVSGLPAGVTGTFEPATIAPGETAVLNLSADPLAPAATTTVDINVAFESYSVDAQGTITIQSDGNSAGGGTGTGSGLVPGGVTNDTCSGYAPPGTTSGCSCASGHSCAANHCYGGWYCNLSTLKCVAPPTSCGTGGGAGGGGGAGCPGYAPPSTASSCSCASGHTCAANNCYSGWYCELSTSKCVAPPASCGGTGGGAGGSGGGSGTGGGSTTGGGSGTGVGPSGGTVTMLHFGITGDTRPPNCEDTAHYPTAIINSLADQFQTKTAQFVVDLGDHMYVCNNSSSIAQTQMGLYMSAVQRYSGTWFMTMGNHECTSGPCLLNSTNANYSAYMAALAPISTRPYYSFDVHTSLGLATFVIVADNGWDAAQQTWLSQTLTTADANAKYTLIFRHHPEGDTSVSTNSSIMTLIRQHKFAMFLSGHTHSYKHMTTDNGRDLVIGLGGAPLVAAGATYNGYAMIDQQTNGDLQVTVHDLTGAVKDTWSVPPN